jgi:hypothetical protein
MSSWGSFIMRKYTTAIAVVSSLMLSASLVHARSTTPSVCKGLDNTACTANAACKWQPERIAGQTLTAKGQPAKTSAKAHCRKLPAPKVPSTAT